MNFLILVLAFIQLTTYSFSQKTDSKEVPSVISVNSSKIDSPKKNLYLKEAITITNNGIAYIPSFSLHKPAVILDLSVGNGKLSLEPSLRFALNFEPWAFLFPVRYKIKSTGKFRIIAGAVPGLAFKTVTFIDNGVSTTRSVSGSYLGGDLRPDFFIKENISVGAYYYYLHGISHGTLKNINLVSVNINFLNIKLGSGLFAKFTPQYYYLNQDGLSGFYFNDVIAMFKQNFPFSLQALMTSTIHTNIPGSDNFIWNVSLIYSFNKTYIAK